MTTKTTTIDTTAQVRAAFVENQIAIWDRKYQAMTVSELHDEIEKTIPVDLRTNGWKRFNKTQLSLELTGYQAGEFESGVYEAQKMRMIYPISDELAEVNTKSADVFNSMLKLWHEKGIEIDRTNIEGLAAYGLTPDCTIDEYVTQIALALGYFARRGISGDTSEVVTDLSHLNAWVWRRPEAQPVIEATPATTTPVTKKASTSTPAPKGDVKSLLEALEAARKTGDKGLQKKIRVALRKAGHYISKQ